MIDALVALNQHVFFALNHSFHWAPVDVLMMWLSETKHFIFIYALLLFFLLWKGGARGRNAAIAIIVTIILTDQICAQIIKPLFHRIRPCHALAGVVNLGGCGDGYSFPSSHAMNMFALAVVLRAFFPRGTWWYFLFALLTAYSRIHLGVHYPLDTFAGAVFGTAIAWCVVWGVRRCAGRGLTARKWLSDNWRAFRYGIEWLANLQYTLPIVSGLFLGLAFPPSIPAFSRRLGLCRCCLQLNIN